MKRVFIGVVAALTLALGAYSEQVLDSGKFFFQMQEDAGIEEFSFVRLDDGNLKLTSNFQALSEELVLDFGTDKLFTQEIVLTPELNLISYRLDSDTERGKIHVKVKVEDSVATIQYEFEEPEGEKERGERTVILEDNVITTGIAASQFFLMQKFIDMHIDLEREPEVILLAFNPVDVDEPLVELTLKSLSPVTLRDRATSQLLEVRRVEASRKDFRVELLSCTIVIPEGPCGEEGRFLGFISSTASLAGVRVTDAPGPGVLVESVAPGSFADQAGLRAGDIILRVNGKEVNDPFQFRQMIRFQDPSVPVILTVQRGGETFDLEVRLSGSSLTVYRSDLFPNGFEIMGVSSP